MTRRRLRGEAGHSLPEMLAGMVVAAIVGWATVTLTLTGSQAATQVQDRTEANQRVRQLLDRMVTTLSSQVCIDALRPPIGEGTRDAVTFYTDLGGQDFAPEQHRLAYDAATRTVTETVWAGAGTPPDVTFPGPGVTRVLATDVEPGPDGLLRYFAFTPAQPTKPEVELPVPISATDARRIVRIHLSVRATPERRAADLRSASQDADAFVGSLEATTDPTNGPRCT